MAHRLVSAAVSAGLAILLVHQPLVWLFRQASLAPWQAFDLTPLAPWGIPALVSAVFWGAAWGPAIAWLSGGAAQPRHARAAAGTALLTTAVGGALTVAGHGTPVPADTAAIAAVSSLAINGAWAAATSMLTSKLALAGTRRRRDRMSSAE